MDAAAIASSSKSSKKSFSLPPRSASMTLRMSLKETFGAASRSAASLAWKSSRYSSGTRPTSRKLMTCPSFIAAPFIVPSAATICSAASIWRFSRASFLPSSPRPTLAARVPSWRTVWPAASRPIFAPRATRPAGMSCRSRAIRSRNLPAQPRAQPGGRVLRRLGHDADVVHPVVGAVDELGPALREITCELTGEDRQHRRVSGPLLDAHRRADLQVLGVVARFEGLRDRAEVDVAAEHLARRDLAERVVGEELAQATLAGEVVERGGPVGQQRRHVQRRLRELKAARDHDREAGDRAGVLDAAGDRDLLAEMRRGREGDRAADLQLGCERGREARGEQRRLAALRVAGDDDALADPRVGRARRTDHVEHRAALGVA